MKEQDRWHAFISYAQSVDAALAKSFRDALQKFAKPVFALRRARVFVDRTSLSASPDLSDRLHEALARTQYLLLFCCPAAAESKWVRAEIEHWLEIRDASTIILLKTAGKLVWDGATFDCSVSDNALPPTLQHAFAAEPLWLDLSGWERFENIEAEPRFRHSVAQVAATLLGLTLDEVVGEDVRAHRRLGRLRNGAIGGLVALAIASALFAVQAQRERDVALERVAAISALNAAQGDPSIDNARHAAALALQAYRFRPSPEAWSAAHAALGSLPPPTLAADNDVVAAQFRPQSGQFVLMTRDRELGLYAENGRLLNSRRLDRDFEHLSWAPDGDRLIAASPKGELALLDVADSTLGMPRSLENQDIANLVAVQFARENNLLLITKQGPIVLDTAGSLRRRVVADIANFAICGSTVVWADGGGVVFHIDDLLNEQPALLHRAGGVVNDIRCAGGTNSVATSTESGQLTWTFSGRTSQVVLGGLGHIELSASGERLAALTGAILPSGLLAPEAGTNRTLLFWRELETPVWERANLRQSDIARFRGETLVTVDEGRAILEVSPSGKVIEFPINHQVDQIALGPSPRSVLLAASGGPLYEYQLDGGFERRLGRTTGWTTAVLSNFDATSHLLISQTQDSTVTYQRSIALLVRPERLASASVSSANLAGASSDGAAGAFSLVPDGASVRVLHTVSYQPLRNELLATVSGNFESLEYSESTGNLLLWGLDGAVMLDRSGTELWRKPEWSSLPSFAADGKLVLHHSEATELVHAANGEQLPLPFDQAAFASASIGVNPGFVSIVDVTSQHSLWDLIGREPVFERQANSAWTTRFSRDGKLYAAVDAQNQIHVIELRNPRNRVVLTLPSQLAGDLVFSPDNARLFAGLESDVVSIDIATGQTTAFLENDGGYVELWVSPTGDTLVIAAERGVTSIVDLSSDTRTLRLSLSESVQHASFCGGGNWGAFGTGDGQVVIVELNHLSLWANLRVDAFVSELAFNDNCNWLLVGGSRTHVFTRKDPAALLCNRQIPSLTPEYWRSLGAAGSPPIPCPRPNPRRIEIRAGSRS